MIFLCTWFKTTFSNNRQAMGQITRPGSFVRTIYNSLYDIVDIIGLDPDQTHHALVKDHTGRAPRPAKVIHTTNFKPPCDAGLNTV